MLMLAQRQRDVKKSLVSDIDQPLFKNITCTAKYLDDCEQYLVYKQCTRETINTTLCFLQTYDLQL